MIHEFKKGNPAPGEGGGGGELPYEKVGDARRTA